MRLLLDSHAFLWVVMAPEKLGKRARNALSSPGNEAFVSAVTFWELSLKYSLGKLSLEGITPKDLPQIAISAGFSLLPMESENAASFHLLPRIAHKDPFDRMLVWQAIHGEMHLLSKDQAFKEYEEYGLNLIW